MKKIVESLLKILCFGVFISNFVFCANDLVVLSSLDTIWSSIIFTIPVDVPYNPLVLFCKSMSNYYCLTSFDIQYAGENLPAFESPNTDSLNYMRGVHALKRNGFEQFKNLFESVYEKHNFYVIQGGCCKGQYKYYFMNGFRDAFLTPAEYFRSLTDYSDESKPLNYLYSYYHIECDVKIIVKIGFGKGLLMHEING